MNRRKGPLPVDRSVGWYSQVADEWMYNASGCDMYCIAEYTVNKISIRKMWKSDGRSLSDRPNYRSARMNTCMELSGRRARADILLRI